MWDRHSGNDFNTQVAHEYDINLVLLFPDRNSFDTLSDYSTFILFDMGCYGEGGGGGHANI